MIRKPSWLVGLNIFIKGKLITSDSGYKDKIKRNMVILSSRKKIIDLK